MRRGDRIAQFILKMIEIPKFVEVEELPLRKRTSHSFGSIGI